jgi:hypothetical protein
MKSGMTVRLLLGHDRTGQQRGQQERGGNRSHEDSVIEVDGQGVREGAPSGWVRGSGGANFENSDHARLVGAGNQAGETPARPSPKAAVVKAVLKRK